MRDTSDIETPDHPSTEPELSAQTFSADVHWGTTVGDLIPISPDGKAGQRVKAFEPNRWMLWGDEAGDSTWYWGLDLAATPVQPARGVHGHRDDA